MTTAPDNLYRALELALKNHPNEPENVVLDLARKYAAFLDGESQSPAVKPTLRRLRWTVAEDGELRRLIELGLNRRAISAMLRRTPAAVKDRRKHLRIVIATPAQAAALARARAARAAKRINGASPS